MNGASDLMVAVFGDKGRHSRTTVGVAALPGDAAVEVDGIFEGGMTARTGQSRRRYRFACSALLCDRARTHARRKDYFKGFGTKDVIGRAAVDVFDPA